MLPGEMPRVIANARQFANRPPWVPSRTRLNYLATPDRTTAVNALGMDLGAIQRRFYPSNLRIADATPSVTSVIVG